MDACLRMSVDTAISAVDRSRPEELVLSDNFVVISVAISAVRFSFFVVNFSICKITSIYFLLSYTFNIE